MKSFTKRKYNRTLDVFSKTSRTFMNSSITLGSWCKNYPMIAHDAEIVFKVSRLVYIILSYIYNNSYEDRYKYIKLSRLSVLKSYTVSLIYIYIY